MDLLDFLTHDELVGFFHRKKSEISCMEEPHIFLKQLRDHDLLPEALYKEVIKRKTFRTVPLGILKGFLRKHAGVRMVKEKERSKSKRKVQQRERKVMKTDQALRQSPARINQLRSTRAISAE
ncbi:hypothetical protein KOW79_010844 [Hemibagrus wyckioides]|uniref:HSR domain-containing protein n=1 Tax=Hemibagrus wyckioides TaxID=337641 RepID=A0A9D3NPR7_9TELE|nr:hypothetical protein KOW79_010844 [Hemibagrus wyckioides]